MERRAPKSATAFAIEEKLGHGSLRAETRRYAMVPRSLGIA
ncbi:MAG TPA: hypothetical protein PLY87_22050 [Planctomycetaceae bacterium]|nr:hypothetical protein [Planctomycetaceae bacterium]